MRREIEDVNWIRVCVLKYGARLDRRRKAFNITKKGIKSQ